jgi:phosphopantothenoylcysteine synthetase/decarboxylase
MPPCICCSVGCSNHVHLSCGTARSQAAMLCSALRVTSTLYIHSDPHCLLCHVLQVAPAMNTFMWESPFTAQHLASIHQLGVTVIDPVSKKLACGDVGQGAMAAPETIAAACEAALCGLGFKKPTAAGSAGS